MRPFGRFQGAGRNAGPIIPPSADEMSKKNAEGGFLEFMRRVERALPAILVFLAAYWPLYGSEQGKDVLRAAVEDNGLMSMLAIAAMILSGVAGTCVGFLAVAGNIKELDAHIKDLEVSIKDLQARFEAVGMLVTARARIKSRAVFFTTTILWIAQLFTLTRLTAFEGSIFNWKYYFVVGLFGLIGALIISAALSWALACLICVVAGSLACLVFVAFVAAQVGGALESALMLAVTASAWILLVTAIAAWRRNLRLPLVGLVALVLVPSLVTGFFMDARQDIIRGERAFRPGLKLEDAYGRWSQRQPDGSSVLVLVAAAGGGIRASYWTSLILARATYRAPSLRNQMFLASGVSGGSLGLGVYRALLNAEDPKCGALEQCASLFHKHDFLAGVLGATMTSSIFNVMVPSFLPGFPPRSNALETAWEEAWSETIGESGPGSKNANAFAGLFTDLFANPGPSLVLNATSTRGGDRMAISDLDTEWLGTHGPCKANIAEHLRLRLSAAVNASARFPFLEDWGSFAPLQSGLQKAGSCKEHETVADGGFIDNYGALTIDDALRKLETLLDAKPEGEKQPRVIVVQITSDPDCSIVETLDPDATRAQSCYQRLNAWLRGAGTLSSPSVPQTVERFLFSDPRASENPGAFDVLMNARTVSGLKAASALRCRVLAMGGSYYHFSMAGAFNNPLGWVLSPYARSELKNILENGTNQMNMDSLIKELTGENRTVDMGSCSDAHASVPASNGKGAPPRTGGPFP